jgi:hypothetical protein
MAVKKHKSVAKRVTGDVAAAQRIELRELKKDREFWKSRSDMFARNFAEAESELVAKGYELKRANEEAEHWRGRWHAANKDVERKHRQLVEMERQLRQIATHHANGLADLAIGGAYHAGHPVAYHGGDTASNAMQATDREPQAL